MQHTIRRNYKDRNRKLKYTKIETIQQITERMKPWYMHHFSTVLSNDFQICSLISKSGVDGSGLYHVALYPQNGDRLVTVDSVTSLRSSC